RLGGHRKFEVPTSHDIWPLTTEQNHHCWQIQINNLTECCQSRCFTATCCLPKTWVDLASESRHMGEAGRTYSFLSLRRRGVGSRIGQSGECVLADAERRACPHCKAHKTARPQVSISGCPRGPLQRAQGDHR